MPSLQEIRSANTSIHTKTPDLALTAVFIGGTAGLGLATLKAFAKHIPHPTALIVGRSKSRFAPDLQDLQTINPQGTYTFIEHETELLRDVDSTSTLIVQALAGAKIDLLYQSQGYISFSGRKNNADGLEPSIALRYYGRVRFTHNLLPSFSPRARAVSILAGTQEGKVFEDDLDLERHYSIPNSMAQFASMMTLSYDHLASQPENKGRAFVHVFPGLASTGLLGRSATGFLGLVFRWVVEPALALLVAAKPEDVGERMLFYGMDADFMGEDVEGRCVPVDDKSRVVENEILRGYREGRLKEKVVEWEDKVFERVSA